MAQRVPGGRRAVGGITAGAAELAIIDAGAARLGKARAEFMRDAALMVAQELLGADLMTIQMPKPDDQGEIAALAVRIAALRRQHGR